MAVGSRWKQGGIGRFVGVRAYLTGLTVMTTLPLVIFALIVVEQLRSNDYAALQRRTTREAGDIAQLVAQQFRDMTTSLKVLGTAPELLSGDLADFHARAAGALAGSDWFMIVVDDSGQQLVNTRVSFGTSLGKISDLSALRETFAADGPYVSNVFFGRTSGRWVYNVMLPIRDAASGDVALILTQNAEDLASSIGERPLPADWNFALLDGRDAVVASSNSLESGSPFSEPLLARVAASELRDGSFEGTEEVLVGFADVPGTSWKAMIWGPRSSAAAAISQTMRNLVLGGLAFILLSLCCGLVLGRRLQHSIAGIARRAQLMGGGQIVSPITSGIREIDQVSVALSEASFDRSQAEDRVQTAMREVAHRTKNLLLIVQVLMTQTLRHSTDMEQFKQAMMGRLSALARSLDLLTSQNRGKASMRELVRTQLEVFGVDTERVRVEGEDFELNHDAVKDVGMMLHEMATNATKYGALSVPEGTLVVRWSTRETGTGELLRFEWQESGGPTVREPTAGGFGSRLMEANAGSLNGTAHCHFEPAGIRWVIEVPLAKMRSSGEVPGSDAAAAAGDPSEPSSRVGS